MRPPVLVGGVGGAVGIELLLQAPARLKQPLGTVAGDRAPVALALRFQRTAALAQPRPTTLRTRHEALRIELDLDAILVLVVSRFGRLVALTLQALLGLAQRLAAALAVRNWSGNSSPRASP